MPGKHFTEAGLLIGAIVGLGASFATTALLCRIRNKQDASRRLAEKKDQVYLNIIEMLTPFVAGRVRYDKLPTLLTFYTSHYPELSLYASVPVMTQLSELADYVAKCHEQRELWADDLRDRMANLIAAIKAEMLVTDNNTCVLRRASRRAASPGV